MPSNSSFLSTTFLLLLSVSGMNSPHVYCLPRPQDSPMERTWRAWRIPGSKTSRILGAHSWDKRSQTSRVGHQGWDQTRQMYLQHTAGKGEENGGIKWKTQDRKILEEKTLGMKQEKPSKSLPRLRCLTLVVLDIPDDVDDLVQGRGPIFLTWQWERHTNFATCH